MYYCLHCQRLHDVKNQPEETVFLTGFVFVDETKYQAGLCFDTETEQEKERAS